MCIGGGVPDNGAGAARAAEEARQASIRQGMSNVDTEFNKFDQPFYDARAKAYTDYYTPQVKNQYDLARKDLVYGLTRQGILNSSAGADQLAKLDDEYNKQNTYYTNSGLDYANQVKGDVENNRSNLYSQVQASADPAAAASAAAARAQTLTAQPAFSPLGQLFSQFAQQGQNAALIGNSGIAKNYTSGLFNSGLGNNGTLRTVA